MSRNNYKLQIGNRPSLEYDNITETELLAKIKSFQKITNTNDIC